MTSADLLTAAQTIDLLGVSRDTLDRMVKQGRLEAIRFTTGPKAQRKFRRADVVALIDGSGQ
jgi:excisionase family DNA binding protein